MRKPPFPITTNWDVPEANTDYVIYIEDLVDHSFENIDVTSDDNAQIQYVIPRSKAQFDRKFLFQVRDMTGEIQVDSNLDVLRPYYDYTADGTTASEIYDAKMRELLARNIIDSVIDEGFYNNKHIVQAVGQGTDYFAIWEDVNRVLRVYENNVLVFDGQDVNINIVAFYDEDPTSNPHLGLTLASAHGYAVGDTVQITLPSENIDAKYIVSDVIDSTSFRIGSSLSSVNGFEGIGGTSKRVWEYTYIVTLDNSAIQRVEYDSYNRAERRSTYIPIAGGDIGFLGYIGTAFPEGFDYTFILDTGYKAIPPDVEYATKLLMEDIKCGKLDYYTRYVDSYNTDQYRIQFNGQLFEGTGNTLVDKILSKYKRSIVKPGIL